MLQKLADLSPPDPAVEALVNVVGDADGQFLAHIRILYV
jgi:hypothetical protein